MSALISLKFMVNGYDANISSELIDLENDLIILRDILSRLPCGMSPLPSAIISAPAQNYTQTVGEGERPSANGGEIIMVTACKLEKTKSGKPYYKLFGGKYSTFGVSMYSDSCKFLDGLNPDSFHIRLSEGIEMLVQSDGKALKVAALRLVKQDGG
jgi:hypothetical protein